MHLMFEQMRQQTQPLLALHPIRPHDAHIAAQVAITQPPAVGDQTVVSLGLLGMQIGAGGKRLFRVEKAFAVGIGLLAALLALEHMQVEPIHRQQMVEGGLDRREEAATRGDELVLGQLQAGLVQAVIGPAIVIGLGQQIMR